MMIAPTTSYMPAVRPPKPLRTTSDEMYTSLMAHYQRMYKRFDTPMRAWPATEKVVTDLAMGRLLQESEQRRQAKVQRQALVRSLNPKRITDKPRVPPFRGECVRNWLLRFKAWRAKRSIWRQEDWLLRSSRGKSHPIFE